jgi:hypothetical protein
MLKFDRLKLATSSQYITNLDPSQFLETPMKQGDYYYKYHQDSPFSLTIINNPRKNELVIEFTGKVLKDEYPSLISRETIRQCFDNICAMNICDLDIDAILDNSEVCLCDVTQDFVCNHPMADIKRHIKASIKNYDKWLVKKCRNNGLEIYNSVTTSRRFKRFILYDKAKEMKRAENREFLACVDDPSALLHQFDGKVRLELNLRSMEQVRNYLHIPNNQLQAVLNTTANPILAIYDEAIAETIPVDTAIYNKAEKLALLEQCNYDLQAVEMKIREHTPKNTSIRRKMEPYRQLLQTIQNAEQNTMNLRQYIK